MIELEAKLNSLRDEKAAKSANYIAHIAQIDDAIQKQAEEMTLESNADCADLERELERAQNELEPAQNELERAQNALTEKKRTLLEDIAALEQQGAQEKAELKHLHMDESQDCETRALRLIDDEFACIRAGLSVTRKFMSRILLPRHGLALSKAGVLQETKDVHALYMDIFKEDICGLQAKLEALIQLELTWQTAASDSVPNTSDGAVDQTSKASPASASVNDPSSINPELLNASNGLGNTAEGQDGELISSLTQPWDVPLINGVEDIATRVEETGVGIVLLPHADLSSIPWLPTRWSKTKVRAGNLRTKAPGIVQQ